MKTNRLEDIDLSQYKLAYYQGDSLSYDYMSQDQVMQLIEGGGSYYERLTIALIPKTSKLTECGGDDWDDMNARDNASGFYKYPEGTIFLGGELGGELKLSDK